LRPHPGVADLSDERLDELWKLLADRDEQQAEKAVWEMAAGQAASVDYIARHLTPIPKVDDAKVKALVAQLDVDDFNSRRKAQEELASFGGLIAPLLEAESQNASAEVRATIRRLLNAIEQSSPSSPEVARDIRIAKMLELVGSAEAVKLLEQLAKANENADRTRAAKRALDRLAKLSEATR